MRKLSKREQAVLDSIEEFREAAYHAWRTDASEWGEDSKLTRVSLAYCAEASRISEAVKKLLGVY